MRSNEPGHAPEAGPGPEESNGAVAPEAGSEERQSPLPEQPAPADPKGQSWDTYPNRGYVQEVLLAYQARRVSFPQTFMAMYIGSDPSAWGSEQTVAAARQMYPVLLRDFEDQNGTILDLHYGESAAGGVVLLSAMADTTPDIGNAPWWIRMIASLRRIPSIWAASRRSQQQTGPRAGDLDAFVWWQWLHFDPQDSSSLLADALNLRDRITTFLSGEEVREKDARDIGLRRLYAVARELIETVDSEEQLSWSEAPEDEAPPNDRRPSLAYVQSVRALRDRLAKLEAVYLAAVQRVAQHEYLTGVFWGFLLLLLLLAGFAVATGVIGFTAGWLAAAVGGVVGAVLSVLQRIGHGFGLSADGEKQSFLQQGFVRPLIGLLLGLASYALLRGGGGGSCRSRLRTRPPTRSSITGGSSS